ncbi:hypothetical protein ACVII1_006277 [Bradyrhizobium elkanii]|uniref:hypothetical protein n=1 Tax=Bradyrhizobium TaxID=374 RepID=UPI002711DE56|nr:hypothetical protein [Bradyrhizobium elkanii]WLA40187.1 hypothetical protein QNJ95_00985 [Bradyrhizobium elkanii]
MDNLREFQPAQGRPLPSFGNKEGDPPSQRYLWIEADEKRLNAMSRQFVRGEHHLTLHDLYLAYHYDEHKSRLFMVNSADQEVRDVIDRFLDLAITEMQQENATVVGLVSILLFHVLETHERLRKQVLGPPLMHQRSTTEVRAEIACVSKTLKRLEQELEARIAAEGAHPSVPAANVTALYPAEGA